MGVSKVIYGDQTLIDLTNDTVAADKLLRGYTAHRADGTQIIGDVAVQGSKTVEASSTNILVRPDSGYQAMEQVVVRPTPASSFTVTPSQSQQIVTPYAGEAISDVTVNPIPSEYIIPSGNKALAYTTNGTTSDIDVRNYETVSVTRSITLNSTNLWTNSSTSSSFADKKVNLTCSHSSTPAITGYDYIAVRFCNSTSDSNLSWAIFREVDFNYTINSGNRLVFGIDGRMRGFGLTGIYTSSTVEISFSKAYQAKSSAQTPSSTYVIPESIVGLKFT